MNLHSFSFVPLNFFMHWRYFIMTVLHSPVARLEDHLIAHPLRSSLTIMIQGKASSLGTTKKAGQRSEAPSLSGTRRAFRGDEKRLTASAW